MQILHNRVSQLALKLKGSKSAISYFTRTLNLGGKGSWPISYEFSIFLLVYYILIRGLNLYHLVPCSCILAISGFGYINLYFSPFNIVQNITVSFQEEELKGAVVLLFANKQVCLIWNYIFVEAWTNFFA